MQDEVYPLHAIFIYDTKPIILDKTIYELIQM